MVVLCIYSVCLPTPVYKPIESYDFCVFTSCSSFSLTNRSMLRIMLTSRLFSFAFLFLSSSNALVSYISCSFSHFLSQFGEVYRRDWHFLVLRHLLEWYLCVGTCLRRMRFPSNYFSEILWCEMNVIEELRKKKYKQFPFTDIELQMSSHKTKPNKLTQLKEGCSRMNLERIFRLVHLYFWR